MRLPTIDLDSDKTIFSVTNVRQSAEYVLLSLGSIGSFRMPRSDDGKYEFKLASFPRILFISLIHKYRKKVELWKI